MVWRFKKGHNTDENNQENNFKLDSFKTLYTSKPPPNKYGA